MRSHSKTPLFLMELIIMLLVFSIPAAICLQVFSGARKISMESRRLDAAVMMAQTAAENWKATHGNLEETAGQMDAVATEFGFSVYNEEDLIQLDFTCENTTANIVVLYGDEEILSLNCEAVMSNG